MLRISFINGFAIFAMFFGGGNLVFPLQIGHNALGYWDAAFWGLFLSDVILPFIGFWAILQTQGDYIKFFARTGKIGSYALPLICLSLLGSFGVVPRCITVTYTSFKMVFPSMGLPLFSFIFCVLMFFICLKKEHIIPLLGKILTPLLLISLSILVIVGLWNLKVIAVNPTSSAATEFKTGFLTGYQIMDLVAAFFFSSAVYTQMKMHVHSPEKQRKILFLSCLIAAICLGGIYVFFVLIGASLNPINAHIASHEILTHSAQYLLGDKAGIILGIAMFLACLTTAVALISIYAQYLQKHILREKTLYKYILVTTLIISFLISIFEFEGIAKILGPTLEVCYPALIALTLSTFVFRKETKVIPWIFYGVLIISLTFKLIGA